MAGKHQISSSLFIQSGSVAQFKNGISASLNLSSSGNIVMEQLVGVNTDIPILNVGNALEDGTFEEWETSINNVIRITASGNFDTFMFIKNDNSTNTWETIKKGTRNGLDKESFINQTFTQPGVYEYFILATNNTTLKTAFKGTTVTVIES
jgi:hypothetical protein